MKRLLCALLLLVFLLPACGRTPAPGIDQRLLEAYGMEREGIMALLELTEKDRDPDYDSRDFYKKEFDWFGRRAETRIGFVGKRDYGAQIKLEADDAFCETIVTQLAEQFGEPWLGELDGWSIRQDYAEGLKKYMEAPDSATLWLGFVNENPAFLMDYRTIGGVIPIPIYCKFQRASGHLNRHTIEICLYWTGEFPEPGDIAAAKTTGIDLRLLNAYGKSPEEAWEILELTEDDVYPDNPEAFNLHLKKYHWFGQNRDTQIVLNFHDSPSGTVYGAALQTSMGADMCRTALTQMIDQLGQPTEGRLWYPHLTMVDGHATVDAKDPLPALEEFFENDAYETLSFAFPYEAAGDRLRPITFSALKLEDYPGWYRIDIDLFDAAIFTYSR